MDDHTALAATATDYIEGWLEGDPERMARALHPDLVKRQVLPDGTVSTLTRDQMVKFTAAGGGRELERGFEIAVLDVYGDVASVRVLSSAYLDHLQLARLPEGWRILNALWQAA